MNNLSPKSLIDLMNEVVNIRKFQDKSVSEADITHLLEAFRHGASTANQQPWEIMVLNDEQKENIITTTLDPFYQKTNKPAQPWLKDAPLLMLVTLEARRTKARFGEFGKPINEQDTFSAVQNLRLMSSLLGLSSAIIREFDHDQLAKVLDLPWNFTPLVMIAVGYSDEDKEYPPRLAVEEFVHWGNMT